MSKWLIVGLGGLILLWLIASRKPKAPEVATTTTNTGPSTINPPDQFWHGWTPYTDFANQAINAVTMEWTRAQQLLQFGSSKPLTPGGNNATGPVNAVNPTSTGSGAGVPLASDPTSTLSPTNNLEFLNFDASEPLNLGG